MECSQVSTWLLAVLLCGVIAPILHFEPRCCAQTRSSAVQKVSLVANGHALGVIVTPKDAPAATQRAIDDLTMYFQRVSGATVPVEHTSMAGRLEIHIGETEYVKSLDLQLEDLATDGFRISFPAADRIVLIGLSPSGTEYAIREFTECYLGVRWLFPGDLGTYVPESRNISVPAADIVSRPAYISRTISTVSQTDRPEVQTWLDRQRRHWTIQHHHNLNHLISPDDLYDQHPEFFPFIDGKRVKPEPEGYAWQPVLHAPGIVEASIERIARYFNDNAYAMSYSLGINDNNNFADAPDGGMNSVGQLDYSDYFFNYANAVVAGVLRQHPEKLFGCLAYTGITDPPAESGVHPRIVPHICIDRHGWASEEHARRDMQRTRDWHAAAPTLGWYDYIYGDETYRIPRMYTHLMARYLKFGSENGVKAMYAEHYASPAWIEGPKLYVFLKLLWDPNADVDALASEWYRLAVGEQAAEPLSQYYAFWEDYWMNRVPRTDWFHQYVDRVYMDFDMTGYLDELTSEDLDRCRSLMEQVVALAETPEQKARARFLAEGFEGVLRDVEYVVRFREQGTEPQGSRLIDDSFVSSSASPDDKVPAPWSSWQNEPGTARFYWDHETGYGDTHCLAINADNAGTSALFHQSISIEEPAEMYYMSARVQCTDEVNDDAYVGVGLRWSKPDGSYLPRKYHGNRFWSASQYEEGKWTAVSFPVRRPPVEGPLNMQVTLLIVYGKKGTVRFDDVTLLAVE